MMMMMMSDLKTEEGRSGVTILNKNERVADFMSSSKVMGVVVKCKFKVLKSREL